MEISDPGSTGTFYYQWLKACESSLGRICEMPAVGPSRERNEKIMKGFPLYMNLYSVWMDFIVDFSRLSVEAMKKMNEKTANMEFDISPEKNRELYNIWIETYSTTFKDFLRTGHFAGDMGKFISGYIEAQKYNREMLEDNFLKPMNLSTRTDIDELNRDLYSLRKTVRELERKVNELSLK